MADTRRPGPAALAAAGLALIAVQGIGLWVGSSGGPAFVARVCDHPVVLGVLALVLLAAALFLRTRSRIVRAETVLVAATLTAGAVGLQAMGLLPDWEVTDRRSAPGNAERTVVVEQASDWIDTLTRVSVEDGSGLVLWRWQVGEFSSDDPALDVASVDWAGPDRLRLTGPDGDVRLVDLAPGSGRPSRTFSRY
ncbi:hypothetical protein [Kitasatospora sp. NPDC051914]|uniref:hypothetical protein n=1 Tax=Kitasatospora sp. NPDC051914 TaxID=3154945 RepID=UPI0034145047